MDSHDSLHEMRRLKESPAGGRNPAPMPSVEVSRTLVKSPPELWAELEGDRLADAVGAVTVRPTGVGGVGAGGGGGGQLRSGPPAEPPHPDIAARLGEVLDRLGSDHKKP